MAWSKETPTQRGYGRAWRAMRLVILKRDGGICQACLKKGIIHAGNQVDHITSKANAKKLGWTDEQIEDESNLQTICREAHQDKTTLEEGKKVRQTIGADGWPT